MAGRANFQVIRPPNRLAEKVPNHGGPDLSTIVNDAESALEDLQQDYEVWIREDLETLQTCYRAAQDSPETAAEMLDKIFSVSQTIKGQGATFEYPLLTMIAESLCKLISILAGNAGAQLELVSLHIDSMCVVVDDGLQGTGGERGNELIAMLRAAVDKATA